MCPTSQPSSALAAAMTTATAPATPPRLSNQNILLWPVFGSDPFDSARVMVAEDVFAYAQGGPDREDTGDARACAILSLGATLSGVGHIVAEIIDSAVGSLTPLSPSPETVARAIVAYNEACLDAGNTDKLKVGLRLTLPIEIDEAASAGNAILRRIWRARRRRQLDGDAGRGDGRPAPGRRGARAGRLGQRSVVPSDPLRPVGLSRRRGRASGTERHPPRAAPDRRPARRRADETAQRLRRADRRTARHGARARHVRRHLRDRPG